MACPDRTSHGPEPIIEKLRRGGGNLLVLNKKKWDRLWRDKELMMNDVQDVTVAAGMLADPGTTAEDLSAIAQAHPTLRTMVALHPNAYPGLLDWLGALGDHAVSAAVASRRAAVAVAVVGPPPLPSFAVVPSVGGTEQFQQTATSTVSEGSPPERNKLLFVSSILVIVLGVYLFAGGITSVFAYPRLSSFCSIFYGVYAVCAGIIGIKNAGNREKAELLVKLGIGLIVLLVLVAVASFVS